MHELRLAGGNTGCRLGVLVITIVFAITLRWLAKVEM
jgi:hypothetical protein